MVNVNKINVPCVLSDINKKVAMGCDTVPNMNTLATVSLFHAAYLKQIIIFKVILVEMYYILQSVY